MRTIIQKRAEFALAKVIQYRDIEKLKNFSAGAPSMILKNGFGQTLAFWKQKWHDEHKALFTIIVEWLSYNNHNDVRNVFATQTDPTRFLQELTTMTQRQYLTCQEETLRLLEWVKRFANADLGGD